MVPLDQPETREEILRHSPAGRVPVLEHGDKVVWDTLAIVEYLNEAFPLAQLWPKDPTARAHARCICAEMHAGFAALRHDMPMNLRRTISVDVQPAARADLDRIHAIWRDCRKRFGGDGQFLFGRYSAADCFYAPVVTRCRTYGIALDPVCEAYAKAVLAVPALQEWTTAARREHWVIRDYEL